MNRSDSVQPGPRRRGPTGRSLVQTGRRALTLAEMVISMVLVSVMLVAALNVAGGVRQGESDSALQRRALILAEDLMAEIMEQDYVDPNEDPNVLGMSAAESATGDRSLFNDVDDYKGWHASPPQLRSGVPMTGLDGWKRMVAVVWVDPDDTRQTSDIDLGAKRITVKVKYNGSQVLRLRAIRTAGLPPLDACCLPDLSCEMLREEACTALGGIHDADGSACYAVTCESCDYFESYDAGLPPDSSWVARGSAVIAVRDDGSQQVLWDGDGGGAPVVYRDVYGADVSVRQAFQSLDGNVDQAGLIARYVDDNNMVYGGIVGPRDAQIWVCIAGDWLNIGDAYDSMHNGDDSWHITNVGTGWHTQELIVVGGNVELYIDGALVGSATLPAGAPDSGYTGFWSQGSNDQGYRDDHCVRPAN